MTEESCFRHCHNNNEISTCRVICYKKKYVAFLTGDLDAAAKMIELFKEYPLGSTGRIVPNIINVFIDGLIGFFYARKHRGDEAMWTQVGLDAIQTLSKWVKGCPWNFSNKLFLLEAEYYFLMEDDSRAKASYYASIREAKAHRFVHEEGLAEEKTATYYLRRNRHNDAMRHYMNAKKCYEAWGATALVQRIDNAMKIMLPLYRDS